MTTLPNANSTRAPDKRPKIKRVVARRGLGGLANDTKWNEFMAGIQNMFDTDRRVWAPSFRYKCVDGVPVGWDVEWKYHLPYPMISVEWFDIAYQQEIRDNRLPPSVELIDHGPQIAELLRHVGLEFETGPTMIRIFGYAPKDMQLFEDTLGSNADHLILRRG